MTPSPRPRGADSALVLLAHGSRHPELGASLGRLVDAVSERAETRAEARAGTTKSPLTVRAAYLDLAEPDLLQVCTELAGLGHRRVVCVPTLFTSAFHAEVDVPESVRAAASASGVELVVADIIGTGDDVADVALQALAAFDPPTGPVNSVGSAGSGGSAPDVILFSVGSSSERANEAVADLGRRLAARLHSEVRVAFGTRDPRGVDVLAERIRAGARPTVLPLFVSPGLLLDPMRAAAERAGVQMLAPLESRLAGVVLDRYLAATDADPPGTNR